jgi:hypothetical protein
MQIVARRFESVGARFVFTGGTVIALLVDNPALSEIRPTKDVDIIVEIFTYAEFSALEERLRNAGFQHDTSDGAPICRWVVEGCRVDVMPVNSTALGMNSRWFPEALQCSNNLELGQNCRANVVTPALFIATKLEAFKDRGKTDYYGSHDIEDIVTVVDGRATIVQDISTTLPEVRAFIAASFTKMIQHPDFRDALPGHLSTLSRGRGNIVLDRFKAIAALM